MNQKNKVNYMGKREKKRVSHEMDAERLKYYKSEEFLEKIAVLRKSNVLIIYIIQELRKDWTLDKKKK